MKLNFIHAILAIIVLAMNCFPATAQPEGEKAMFAQKPVLKNAQELVEALRQNRELRAIADIQASLPNLMVGNRPDPKAMEALGEELRTGTEDTRVEIIKFLDEIRYFADPGHELRTPEVIALLVGPALVQGDNARGLAMRSLYTYASVPTLFRHKDVFTKALREDPEGGEVLLLVAKAKALEAREDVERLSRLPEWNVDGSPNEPVQIARAALGDTKIEDTFLAVAEKDQYSEGPLLHLAQIGTKRSLQAVCQRVRSPLIVDLKGVHEKSVRLFAIDALRYAYPERPELAPFGIHSDEDYIKVEEFCIKELGVRFHQPRPEFFTTIPYPIN